MSDIERNDIDPNEDTSSELFTWQNAVIALGFLLLTVGSVLFISFKLTAESVSRQTRQTNSVTARALVFDEISISTANWAPFAVENKLYGTVPKAADNTCTLLGTFNNSLPTLTNLKLSKDKKFIYFYNPVQRRIERFDVDAKTLCPDFGIHSTNPYFAVTNKHLTIGTEEITSNGIIPKLIRYKLDQLDFQEEFKTRCTEQQTMRVLASASDDSKIYYACRSISNPDENPIIHYIDFQGDPHAQNYSYRIITMPDLFVLSPNNHYALMLLDDKKTLLLLNLRVATGATYTEDFSSIRNITFSDDGKSIYLIKKDTKSEAVIQVIDFLKFRQIKQGSIGPRLVIEFPQE